MMTRSPWCRARIKANSCQSMSIQWSESCLTHQAVKQTLHFPPLHSCVAYALITCDLRSRTQLNFHIDLGPRDGHVLKREPRCLAVSRSTALSVSWPCRLHLSLGLGPSFWSRTVRLILGLFTPVHTACTAVRNRTWQHTTSTTTPPSASLNLSESAARRQHPEPREEGEQQKEKLRRQFSCTQKGLRIMT